MADRPWRTWRRWRAMFVAAALFNFAIGVPIILFPGWTYGVAYVPPVAAGDAVALRFWGDFGYAVTIIGAGYLLVARDPAQNRGLVWVGVAAKLFDVMTLTSRFATGLARPVALLPALIDGAFVILFLLFLYRMRPHHERVLEEPTTGPPR